MNISKEAIEAAAEAIRASQWVKFTASDGYTSVAQNDNETIARNALEAAAPLLVAQALRDSADDFKGEDLALDVILAGPDAVRHHLNSRADEVEQS